MKNLILLIFTAVILTSCEKETSVNNNTVVNSPSKKCLIQEETRFIGNNLQTRVRWYYSIDKLDSITGFDGNSKREWAITYQYLDDYTRIKRYHIKDDWHNIDSLYTKEILDFNQNVVRWSNHEKDGTVTTSGEMQYTCN